MLTPEQVQEARQRLGITFPTSTQPKALPQDPRNPPPGTKGKALADWIDNRYNELSGKPKVGPDYFAQNVSQLPSDLEARGKQLFQEQTQAGEDIRSGHPFKGIAEGAMSAVHATAGAFGDIVNRFVVSPVVQSSPGLQKMIQSGGESFLQSKNATGETNADTIQKLEQYGKENPFVAKIARTLGDVATFWVPEEGIPLAAQGAKGATEAVAQGLETGAQTVSKVASAGVEAATPTLQKIPGVRGFVEETPQAKLTGALKDISPDYKNMTDAQKAALNVEKVYTKTPTGEEIIKPRIEESTGITGTRTLNLHDLEKEAAKELSKVPGYSSRMTSLEKVNLVENEIASRGEALSQSLKTEGQIVPPREVASTVRNAVDKVSQDSLILQKGDPYIKNYMRVLDNAIRKNPGTLEGVNDIRKAMDAAYKNARGKLAFGSDKIGALDEIHQAARDSLTDLLIKRARNTDVKAALRAQWNLYRALDVLGPKSGKEGSSAIRRFIQNNPKKIKVAGATAAILGVTGGYKKIANAATGND